jgi:hypothetical protein
VFGRGGLRNGADAGGGRRGDGGRTVDGRVPKLQVL